MNVPTSDAIVNSHKNKRSNTNATKPQSASSYTNQGNERRLHYCMWRKKKEFKRFLLDAIGRKSTKKQEQNFLFNHFNRNGLNLFSVWVIKLIS